MQINRPDIRTGCSFRCVKTLLLPLASVLCILLSASPCLSQTSQSGKKLEDFIAAAHYHVISFSNWEKDSESTGPITVCIDKTHSIFDNIMKTFSGGKIRSRELAVKIIQEVEGIDSVCQVIILGGNSDFNKTIIGRIGDLPILTMSSEEDITSIGGPVYITNKTPKIHLGRLRKINVRIDSRLLAISEIIGNDK